MKAVVLSVALVEHCIVSGNLFYRIAQGKPSFMIKLLTRIGTMTPPRDDPVS
jgi:hypothetical protein